MSREMLLPKNKCDVQAVDALKGLPDEEIMPLIPMLLTWLQDWNWPVALPAAQVLADHGEIAEPYIVPLLHAANDDDVWKYYIITELLPKMPGKPSKQLLEAVVRVAENPTEGEKCESVHEAAKAYIESWNLQRKTGEYV